MTKSKYKFTSHDLLKERRGHKTSEDEFYRYIPELRKKIGINFN